jgi:Skp family chaperone for outer membrane proteins
MAALDFEEIADELYGLRPDEFTAARDEHVARARAEEEKALARDLGKLRRPTQTAWLVNQLWRDQRSEVEELLDLTDEFGAAMAAGDGRRLQALTVTRREVEGRLVQRATALAADAGVAASADVLREVQETLGAALVSSEAAGQVRSGRLVRPLAYSGFGPGLAAVGQVSPAGRKKAPSGGTKTTEVGRARPKSAKAERADADTDTRRAAVERELAEAREAMSAAEDELAERSRAAEQTEDEYATLSERLAELREQVRQLDQQVVTARQIAAKEQRRRDQAEKAYERARTAVQRAEKRLG